MFKYFLCFFLILAHADFSRDSLQSRGVHKLYHEQTLERKIKSALDYTNHMKYRSDLTVRVYRDYVIVIGRVSNDADLSELKEVLNAKAPHLHVRLYVSISEDSGDAMSASRDEIIKMQVRAELLRRVGWAAGQIRVVVYQQHVYLIGPIGSELKKVMSHLESIAHGVTIINIGNG